MSLRLLVVIERLGAGGTEQQLVYMLPELVRRGFEVEVATVFRPHGEGFDRPMRAQLTAAGISVHDLDVSRQWNLGEGAFKLGRLIRRGRYDVVHGKLFFAALHTALSRLIAPVPARVVSFHNLSYDYAGRRPTSRARQQLEALALRAGVDAFAAVSRATADSYRRHLGIAEIEVIPNAIPVATIRRDPSLDRAAVLARYGIAAGESVLAVPARQIEAKGHVYLLRGLQQLAARGKRPRVIMLGRGPLLERNRAEIERLGLADQVVLRGEEVPHDEVLRVVAVADVVVLPSIYEGFPNAAAEAMALGAPLLATRVGGLLDLVEEEVSGILVPAADPSALASSIERLLLDPALRERIGQAGRERVERHFDVSVVAAQWERFYARLLSARRARAGVMSRKA